MPILCQLDVIAEPTASPPLAAVDVPFQQTTTPEGFPEIDFRYIAEPVVSGGVNFTRARVPRVDYPRFNMTGIIGAEDYEAAVVFSRIYRTLEGRRTAMTFNAGGVNFDFSGFEFYIWAAASRPVNGTLVVADEVFESYVEAVFTLQRYL